MLRLYTLQKDGRSGWKDDKEKQTAKTWRLLQTHENITNMEKFIYISI
jgi:hypothetical protein